ncbi:MAG: chemotaxis protein CheB [Burkholderiales bacterium]|nr:chemotaxis protein CheB [Burkholderiales bacterium]
MSKNKHCRQHFSTIVIGTSSGGVEALKYLLPALPENFPLPVLIVIHIAPDSGDGLAKLLDSFAKIHVKEADEGEQMRAGFAYLAPANYHLLLESDGKLALSTDVQVNFARPSVDVLFDSAASSLGSSVIGVILTGGANDGARGLAKIHQSGGYTIVQDPRDAKLPSMPQHALQLDVPDKVICLREMPALLLELSKQKGGLPPRSVHAKERR